MVNENTDQIRERLRAARSAQPAGLAAQRSHAACQSLIQSPRFSAARRMAGFLAFKRECDPLAAMTLATAEGRTVYVPILADDALQFAPWAPHRPTRENRFGIAEPVHAPEERIDPRELDLVITPLVAFDPHGHRIGMGGGYYDRTFAFLGDSRRPDHPRLVGFAYDLQRVAAIQAQSWDIALDAVVTESGWTDLPTENPDNGDSN